METILVSCDLLLYMLPDLRIFSSVWTILKVIAYAVY